MVIKLLLWVILSGASLWIMLFWDIWFTGKRLIGGPCKITWYIFSHSRAFPKPVHYWNNSPIIIPGYAKNYYSEKISIILWSKLSEWLRSSNIVQNETNVLVINNSFFRRTNIGPCYAKMPCLGCVKKIFRVAIMKNIFSDIVPRFNVHNRRDTGGRSYIITRTCNSLLWIPEIPDKITTVTLSSMDWIYFKF